MYSMKSSNTLMVGGFAIAALCWAVIMFADLSEGLRVMAWIGQALGIGLGSIGIGARVAQGARR